jgi:RimJ/RimL family protein N-acetyltransferase
LDRWRSEGRAMNAFAAPRIPLAIESARLALRLPAEADWRALHAYYGDADSVRYTVGAPLTEAQTWRTLAGVVGHWAWRGYGPYVLQDRRCGDVLGVAGLWFPNDWPEPEIKWALVPQARGKGYAAEAARSVRAMAREHLPGVRLISLIAIGNEASVRVALAAGACFEREIDFRGGRAAIYRHED